MEANNHLQLLRKAIQREVRKLSKLEALVRDGQIDGVHDFRVALRRIRSAFRLIEGDKEARKLRKTAKEFADAVGAVRDLDVLMARKRAPDPWLLTLRLERRLVLGKVEEALSGKGYRRWKRRVGDWLDEKPNGSNGKKPRELIGGYTAEVLRLALADSDAEYHQLRIAVKHLRYTLEFLKTDLPAKLQAQIPKLAKVQDGLGEYHDVDVAMSRMDEALTASSDLSLRGDLNRYLGVLQRDKKRMRPQKFRAEALVTAKTVEDEIGRL